MGLKVRYDNINSIIEKYVTKHEEVSSKEIARLIIKEKKLDYNDEHLATIIRKYRHDNELTTTVPIKDSHDGERYHVSDNIYTWKTKHDGVMNIPVEIVDNIFYEFSRHGLNMTQAELRQKHNLSIRQWHSLKSTLWLYKESNIFSPWTEQNTPKEHLQEMMAEKMDMKFSDKKRLIIDEYNRATIKQYNKVIKKGNIKAFALETMLDELNDLMPKVQRIEVARTSNTSSIKNLVVSLADLHIGAKVEGIPGIPDYNPDIAKRYLRIAAENINKMKAQKVTICMLGDLIESFTGLNHINTWKYVDSAYVGAKAIYKTLEILEEFFSHVNNLDTILFIGGNHDRTSSDNKEDRESQVVEIIQYMMKRIYGGAYKIDYSPVILNKTIDGIHYILAHGDKNIVKKDGKQAVIDHGNSTLFNLILTGHLHSRIIKEDQKSYRWMVCPSVFPGNYYSFENGFTSSPGMILIYNGGNGKPVITDISF